MLITLFSTYTILQILVALFLTILFLQSGLDKVIDRHGNLRWLIEHFAKSPLAGTVKPMFNTITILELLAGALSALGILQLVFLGSSSIAFWGAIIAGFSLTALFFGQRISKDYAGAAAIVPYFLLTLVAIWLLGAAGRVGDV